MEIKFRGKRVDNGQWIYGDLLHLDKNFEKINNILDWSSEKEPYNHTVIKESVGQYVNLNDSANNLLFVGDLFKCETNDIIYRIWAVDGGFAINTSVQIWQKDIKNDYPFPLQPLSDEQTVSWIKSSCIKIGNIIDNPELLECPVA